MINRRDFAQATVTQAWDQIADWWVRRIRSHTYGDPFRRHLLTPLILDLLDSVEGARILDFGCGEGYLTRLLASRGAQVVGTDVSQRLLEAAVQAERGSTRSITYQLAGNGPLQGHDTPFDHIVCNMVLMDIPDYRSAVAALRNVLKEGGGAVWTILHPETFREDGRWLLNPELRVQRVRLDDHCGRWACHIPMEPDAPVTTPYFHRTVEDYIQTLRSHGFNTVEAHDPAVPPEMSAPWRASLLEHGVMSPVLVFETEAV